MYKCLLNVVNSEFRVKMHAFKKNVLIVIYNINFVTHNYNARPYQGWGLGVQTLSEIVCCFKLSVQYYNKHIN